MTAKHPPEFAWKDGHLIAWDDCTVHVRSQAGFFGANVFEGVRGYWSDDREQLYLFRMDTHFERLALSMKVMRLEVGYTADDMLAGVIETIRANGFREHLQCNVVAHFGLNLDQDPLYPTSNTGVHITAIRFPRSPKTEAGIHACIPSWRRISDSTVPPRVKVGANYQNSRLAANEARINGYDMPIILNERGTIAEGPGSCLFMLREGRLHTPAVTDGILESITRDTLIVFARDILGIEVVERSIDRTELYAADEVLMCGSIAEVTPVISVDRLPVGRGTVGPVATALRDLYFRALIGDLPGYEHWLTPVYDAAALRRTA
ncbi:putative branched-chain-amino-acid aminotransferase [Tistrella bauzanensis]|uniref:Branched-chain-amino-acid aminotransferase n=1 Tax=Tistrella bauzanensis TaxID=657419 RepID=A0ABQ1IJ51_9PROT|nr:branched-chain-amino-acid transaminase [Tistrella bauzanensis]GGB40519.1 putative branched-chain-amino-acid aminotransferase [Tistrella bauzanensis]